jgi:hypothetical protein
MLCVRATMHCASVQQVESGDTQTLPEACEWLRAIAASKVSLDADVSEKLWLQSCGYQAANLWLKSCGCKSCVYTGTSADCRAAGQKCICIPTEQSNLVRARHGPARVC